MAATELDTRRSLERPRPNPAKERLGIPTDLGAPRTARRADIQGLRALAVLLVVVFHAGLPLPGGSYGVDLFFAISGFVITSVLVAELASTGGLSLPRFYLRR